MNRHGELAAGGVEFFSAKTRRGLPGHSWDITIADDMATYADAVENARRIRRTLGVVAAMYVVIGFALAIPAAVGGDRLTAFLGFLIVSGALSVAFLINALTRIGVRVAAMADAVDALTARMPQTAHGTTIPGATSTFGTVSDADAVDLADVGRSEAGDLSAATLEPNAYPRLAVAMDEQPPAESDPEPGERTDPVLVSDNSGGGADAELSVRNLMRTWVVARRNGDVAACRRIYSVLMDIAGVDLSQLLSEQLSEVTDRARIALRDQFADQVRTQNYSAAIETGEAIREQFPDSTLVDEFDRIRPFLLRRLRRHSTESLGSRR